MTARELPHDLVYKVIAMDLSAKEMNIRCKLVERKEKRLQGK